MGSEMCIRDRYEIRAKKARKSERNRKKLDEDAMSFTIYGQTKVYELIIKIEGTNQSTRNALSEVENLIKSNNQKQMSVVGPLS